MTTRLRLVPCGITEAREYVRQVHRLKKAEEVVTMARQLTAYAWEDRLEDCEVSDNAKQDSRELSTAVWLYDQSMRYPSPSRDSYTVEVPRALVERLTIERAACAGRVAYEADEGDMSTSYGEACGTLADAIISQIEAVT